MINDHASPPDAVRGTEEIMAGALPVIVWAIDRAGIFTLLDGGPLARLGLRPGAGVGRSVYELFADFPGAPANVVRVLAGETFVATVRGRALAFKTYFFPDFDERGGVRGASGVAIDVTDGALAQEARMPAGGYGEALAGVAEGVLVHGADGRLRFCNRAAVSIMGLHAGGATLAGTTLALPALREDGSPMPDDERPANVTRRTGRPCTHVIMGVVRPDDGRHVWLRVHTEPLVEPGEVGACGVLESVADITETRAAVDALTVLSSALEQTADHVLITDRLGHVLYVNPAFEVFTGYRLAEIIGLTPRVLKSNRHPPEFYAGLWQRLLEGRIVRRTFVNRKKDGSLYHEEKTIAPIRDRLGRITHFVSTGRDITERKREEETRAQLQEALRRSEIMSTMGRLVAGVAHEVRNPLFSISAIVDAFEAESVEVPELHEYAVLLRNEVARLSQLMQELLDYGNPTPPALLPGPLRVAIERAVANCTRHAERAGVTLALDVADLPPVAFEQGRLVQVFQNLLENAIQHSPRGGRVALRATPSDDRSRVECAVVDEGPGFGAGDLARLFEPFFTRRRGGTGLGLAIVQRIVLEHGGRVAARNRPGGGAEVEITLPCARAGQP